VKQKVAAVICRHGLYKKVYVENVAVRVPLGQYLSLAFGNIHAIF